MNTYIWHTEYNYYACMAETIKEARAIIKEKFVKEKDFYYEVDFNNEPDVILKPGEFIKVFHANE